MASCPCWCSSWVRQYRTSWWRLRARIKGWLWFIHTRVILLWQMTFAKFLNKFLKKILSTNTKPNMSLVLSCIHTFHKVIESLNFQKGKDLYDRIKTRQLPCLSFTNPVSSSSSLLLSTWIKRFQILDCQQNLGLSHSNENKNDEEYVP